MDTRLAEKAVTFEVVDLRTSDILASFSESDSAEKVFLQLVDEEPEEAPYLALFLLDDQGHAIGSRIASDFGRGLL